MNTEEFIEAYQESRNGVNQYFKRKLFPKLVYSDGVKECAEAGCYWLLDILATEIKPEDFHKKASTMCIVTVAVNKAKEAYIRGDFFDGDEAPFKRHVPYTDLPVGDWTFYLHCDPEQSFIYCTLPTEY